MVFNFKDIYQLGSEKHTGSPIDYLQPHTLEFNIKVAFPIFVAACQSTYLFNLRALKILVRISTRTYEYMLVGTDY